jgi:hypothetical protein
VTDDNEDDDDDDDDDDYDDMCNENIPLLIGENYLRMHR